jgi:hypothetical protein
VKHDTATEFIAVAISFVRSLCIKLIATKPLLATKDHFDSMIIIHIEVFNAKSAGGGISYILKAIIRTLPF